jgi:hydrogenase nickel insertion protein HypA
MHEFSFASSIVDVVMQNVQKNHVTKVIAVLVEVGEFTMIIPDFLRNSYDIIKENYPELIESKIMIKSVPGQVQCNDCGAITEISFKKASDDAVDASLAMMNPGAFTCMSCSSSSTTIVSGRQALVKSMKVDE